MRPTIPIGLPVLLRWALLATIPGPAFSFVPLSVPFPSSPDTGRYRCASFSLCSSPGSDSAQTIATARHINSTTTAAAAAATSASSGTTTTTTTTEAEMYLERARQMRLQIAALTGQSIEQVEKEAAARKEQQQQQQRAAVDEAQSSRNGTTFGPMVNNTHGSGGRIHGPIPSLPVPDTMDDQIAQAKRAVERAYYDANRTRQIVRFALIPTEETLWQRERSWPGGAQEMHRTAVGPTARGLLQQLRCVAPDNESNTSTSTSSSSYSFVRPPTVTSADVWDFDGSSLVTAQATQGPLGDVQALVQANTDNRYTRDIATLHDTVGPSRLLLLVNPFWRDVSSWGWNLLAPRAQSYAQEVIWDECQFAETYSLLQKSVRGEDCVALLVYPYDWQLYAYTNDDGNDNYYRSVHLGSTLHEPTSSDFSTLLNQRPEFQLGKTMRRLQQRNNNNRYY